MKISFFLIISLNLFCQKNKREILFQSRNFDSSLYEIYYLPASNHSGYDSSNFILIQNRDLDSIDINEKTVLKKKSQSVLPKLWTPIYEFRDQLCLYDPCDGIFKYMMELIDTSLIWINFEEQIFYPILKREQKNKSKWIINTESKDQGINSLNHSKCFIQNSNKGYLLSFNNLMYINWESVQNYPIIKNDCSVQKWREFQELKIPDCQKYMQVMRHK